MRIAEIVSAHSINGAAVHVSRLAQHLVERGHEVTLICRPESWVARHPSGADVVPSDLHRWPGDELRRIAAILDERKIDVVHTHMSRAHLFGVLLKLFVRVPVVATAHSHVIQPHWLLNDHVIAVSEAVARFQRRWNLVPRRRLTVVRNFIDARDPEPGSRARGRARLRVDDQAFLMGVVGNVFVEKGILHLIEALPALVARVPRATLAIVGRGPADYRSLLESRARALDVSSRIVWTGELDPVDDAFAALDVLVVPSLEAPLTLVCLEAMAAGLPIVATRVGGLPEVVQDNENGLLVPPASPAALAAAIGDLAGDPDRARRFGERGRERARRDFSPERQVPLIEDALAAAVATHRGSSTAREAFRELAAVAFVATAMTVVMAWPVLESPQTRLFGTEFAGRFRDPFVVAQQYAAGHVPSPYLQPATDLPGILLARAWGSIAAVNAVVLLSFPLAAMTMYAVVRRLTGSALASGIAALAFAWSPFHVTHAAYHPHIAQVQWWPLYFLAMWRLGERPGIMTAFGVVAAGLLLAASSFYWALVAVVLTPVALAAFAVPKDESRRRSLMAGAALVAALGALAIIRFGSTILAASEQAVFPRGNLELYSAWWFSYLLPTLDHPLGAWSGSIWARADIRAGLVEQQIGSAWSLLGLGAAAIVLTLTGGDRRIRRVVLWLTVAGAAAFVCSLGPDWRFGRTYVPGLPALVYPHLPMFRSYARFAVVVTLVVSALAGIGVSLLWRKRAGRTAAAALLALACLELRPLASRWRDTLPMEGYRWLIERGGAWKALDCTPPGREYGPSVAVLLGARVAFRETPFDDCGEPALADKLATLGYTHVMIRHGSREGRWLATGGRLAGLEPVAEFEDHRVLRVNTSPAPAYTGEMIGFSPREFDGPDTWRVMARDAEWLVTNRDTSGRRLALQLVLEATGGPRRLEVSIGDRRLPAVTVDARGRYLLEPIVLPAGESRLRFHVVDGDSGTHAAQSDPRPAVRFHDWRWIVP